MSNLKYSHTKWLTQSRSLMLFAGLAYPIWGGINHLIQSTDFNNIYFRTYYGVVIIAALALTFVSRFVREQHRMIVFVGAMTMLFHEAYIVWKSSVSVSSQLTFLLVLAGTSLVMSTKKSSVTFITSVVLLLTAIIFSSDGETRLKIQFGAVSISFLGILILSLWDRIGFIEHLQQKENEHRSVLSNLLEGIVVQDSSGAIVNFNPSAMSILGLSEDELLGRSSMDPRWNSVKEDESPFPGEEHPAMVCLKTGQEVRDIVMGVNKPNGSKTWIRINSRPLLLEPSGKVRFCVTSFADITEMRLSQKTVTEQQMRLAETAKLTALGEMASGVAHEINNPLSIIIARAQKLMTIAKSGEFKGETVMKYLESIESTSMRISKIVKGMRTFARDDKMDDRQYVTAKSIIEDTLILCQAKLKHNNVELILELNDSGHLLNCWPVQISQILLNFIQNAHDATLNEAQPKIWIRTMEHQTSFEFVVEDNGPGVPEDVVGKIMNPFFTTKEVGKGTGLGLSISRGLAELHGGAIRYERRGDRTAFILVIPMAEKFSLAS